MESRPPPSHRTDAPPSGYLARSRTLTYSLSFALPLLLTYELLVSRVQRPGDVQIRNLGDWVVRAGLGAIGVHGSAQVTAALIVLALALIAREQHRRPVPIRPHVFGLMLAESLALAICLGSVVRLVTQGLLAPLGIVGRLGASAPAVLGPGVGLRWLASLGRGPSPGAHHLWPPPLTPAGISAQLQALPRSQQIVLALGAGLYEEIVFRVILVTAFTALVLGLARFTGARLPRSVAVGTAVVAAALVFSLFHYIGPLGQPLGLWSFAFRFVAGLAFSTIYALRGFGIDAWTHALYDVLLIMGGG